jgi:hypothetical protein
MSIHLPWSLLVAYSVFSTAVFIQHDIVRRTEFFGRPTAPMPLQVSAALGGLIAIGTLIHFFLMTPWYWVFALLALSAVVGGLALGIARVVVGDLAALGLSYIAWPIAAIWSNAIIADLPS